MVARVVKIGRAILAPGAVATAEDFTVIGKTQGPCDYAVLDLDVPLTATVALTNGVMCGIDRVEVQIDSSADEKSTDTGSIFYTMYGGRDCAAAYAAVGCLSHGMLETVSRMLFHMDCIMDGIPTATVAAHHFGATIRLPIGKNVPVTFSVHIYMAPTARWCAAGWTYIGNMVAELYGHIVDSVADLKIKQQAFTGLGAQAESPFYDIPNVNGYWFLGYSLDCRVAALAPYVNRLGGGNLAPTVTKDGWARVSNSDGVIFDNATGSMIKADMLEKNSPYNVWTTLEAYTSRDAALGQYARLMASPISAENLKLQLFCNSAALVTDLWRVWYFYSKKGAAIKAVNQQQSQTTDFGAAGASSAQDKKA